jgi:hypothetical protein
VPIQIRWSADDASGIQSYELWRSTNGGAYVRVALAFPKARYQTDRLAPDNSYRYFVRAYDNVGNASAATYGPTFTPRVIDDRVCCNYNASMVPWTRVLLSSAYNGTFTKLYSTSVGSGNHGSAVHYFTGRDVAYLAVVGSVWSTAAVSIDGRFYRYVGLGGFVDGGAQIVFSKHWPTLAAHWIEVSTGDPNGYINVDAFVEIQ